MDFGLDEFVTEGVILSMFYKDYEKNVRCYLFAMKRMKFYFDCVYVDLFVINITQRLLQSVHCKLRVL